MKDLGVLGSRIELADDFCLFYSTSLIFAHLMIVAEMKNSRRSNFSGALFSSETVCSMPDENSRSRLAPPFRRYFTILSYP
jgi:hypothetical protein